MSKKTRNILMIVVLGLIGVAFITYGCYTLINKKVDVVEAVTPDFTDSDVDYRGNTWRLEAYNNENGRYVSLEIYMEEDHDMKWYGSVASGQAEINYIIYQNDHYTISVNPHLDSGSSELGFIFDALEPDHSHTATYLYYSLSIDVSENGVDYRVIGGELTDEVSEIEHDEGSNVGDVISVEDGNGTSTDYSISDNGVGEESVEDEAEVEEDSDLNSEEVVSEE